jgi:Tfp pilus assembly protein FimT
VLKKFEMAMCLDGWRICREGNSMVGFRTAMKDTAAFSLIELCLAMAAMAVLGAISIPMLSSTMRGMQLSSEARKIATALMDAKLSASSQTNPYRVFFKHAENSWQLERFDQTAGEFVAAGAENTLSDGLANSGIAFRINSSLAVTGYPASSSESITFNARGFPIDDAGAPTASNVIYLSDADADFAITVTLTGKTQVLKKTDNSWTCNH